MRYHSQKSFGVSLLEFHNTRKVTSSTYPVHIKKSSHDIGFDKNNYGALSYMPRPYSEALTEQPSVLYIPYNTSSHEQTDLNYFKRVLIVN